MDQYINQIQIIINEPLVKLETLMTIYGVISLVFYIPGGWIADRVSPRLLFTSSMFFASLLSIWYSFIGFNNWINFSQLVVIYTFYALVNSLIFWSGFLKAIALLDEKKYHTKLYARSEVMRNVIASIVGFICIGLINITSINTIFNSIYGVNLFAILMFYGLVNLVIALLGAIFIPGPWIQKWKQRNIKGLIEYKPATWNTIIICNDEDMFALARKNYNKLFWEKVVKDLKVSSKNIYVWLISLVIFFTMNCYAILTAFGSIFTLNYGISIQDSSILAYVYNYLSPIIGCLFFNRITSKKTKSSSKSVMYSSACLFIVSIFMCVLITVANSTNIVVVGVIGVILISIMMVFIGGNRAIYWSIMDEAQIDRSIFGIATGLISIIGFSENIWINPISALLMEHGNTGEASSLYYSNEAFLNLYIFNLANAFGALIISLLIYVKLKNIKIFKRLLWF